MDDPAHRRRTRRRPVLVGGAVALAAAAAVAVLAGARGAARTDIAATTAPSAPAAASHAPSAPPASASVPGTSTATRPSVPHEPVAAAAPTAFTYRDRAFTIGARVCGMAYVRPLDPPGEQHHTVCWVRHDFGFAPGTDGRGTTYVLGHAWAEDPHEVLNRVSAAAMRQVLPQLRAARTTPRDGVPTFPVTRLDGDVITLRTARGTLAYTVRDAYAVAKERAGDVSELMAEHTRNRLVLITCGELGSRDYDYNIVVEAYLTSSVAA